MIKKNKPTYFQYKTKLKLKCNAHTLIYYFEFCKIKKNFK